MEYLTLSECMSPSRRFCFLLRCRRYCLSCCLSDALPAVFLTSYLTFFLTSFLPNLIIFCYGSAQLLSYITKSVLQKSCAIFPGVTHIIGTNPKDRYCLETPFIFQTVGRGPAPLCRLQYCNFLLLSVQSCGRPFRTLRERLFSRRTAGEPYHLPLFRR